MFLGDVETSLFAFTVRGQLLLQTTRLIYSVGPIYTLVCLHYTQGLSHTLTLAPTKKDINHNTLARKVDHTAAPLLLVQTIAVQYIIWSSVSDKE